MNLPSQLDPAMFEKGLMRKNTKIVQDMSVLQQGWFAQFFALVAMAETAQMLSVSLNMMIEISNYVLYISLKLYSDI